MELGIVLFVLLGTLGVISIISGISAWRKNDSMGTLGIVFGSLIVGLTIVCLIAAIINGSERTEKIVGKGVITKSDDIDYIDGGGISSDKVIFYFLMKNGDKIIVDKTEWEKNETEFTYKITEVERVKE